MKPLSDNRVARHKYAILDSFVAGIVLTGTEVKSIKSGQVQLRDAFVRIVRDEAFLFNCHVPPYSHGNYANHDPLRTRKMLMKKKEISKLIGKTKEKGLTLVPLKMFLQRGFVKVEIGLCKGKKEHDKRESMKQRDAGREMARAVRGRG